jgi:hypothetical protein
VTLSACILLNPLQHRYRLVKRLPDDEFIQEGRPVGRMLLTAGSRLSCDEMWTSQDHLDPLSRQCQGKTTVMMMMTMTMMSEIVGF